MDLNRLEKWYAIRDHAKAIIEYANAQTAPGESPAVDDRVAYRAERIRQIALTMSDGDD
jgi:hypothetical protein